MKPLTFPSLPAIFLAAGATGLALLASGCGGSSSRGATAATGPRAFLTGLSYGRLVDVHAYRRVDAGAANRLDASRRTLVLVERDVLVNPLLEDEILADNPEANYRFLPFDPVVGQEEVVILWDDTHPEERGRFEQALAAARGGLVPIPDAHRDQNVLFRPIPVVPRNAAIQLTFDRPIGLPSEFFDANPGAVQVLLVIADPAKVPPQDAYIPLDVRVVARDNRLIVDPTLIGRAVGNRQPNPNGLPPSPDTRNANVRIALPTSGPLARTFRLRADPSQEFNSVDSRGEAAVVRDFRVANPEDGMGGFLPDFSAPRLVRDFSMGILDVDVATRTLLVNKRGAQVAIRGRIPFVEGSKDPVTGLPLGSAETAGTFPLRTGDVVFQDVELPGGEFVRLRAEVLENLEIGSVLGGTPPPGRGTDPAGDSSSLPTARLVVSNLEALDARGNLVRFEASDLPLGADCTVRVHYADSIQLRAAGGGDVGDAGRREQFVTFEPSPPELDPVTRQPNPRNRRVSPFAAVTVRFSKPMDLSTVRELENFVLTTPDGSDPVFLLETKPGALSSIPARPADQDGDAMAVRLTPSLGLFHRKGTEERYFLHVFDGEVGIKDLSGNELDLGDFGSDILAFTLEYFLDRDAEDNLVAWVARRFHSADEDGTKPGIDDYWGQFQIDRGRLKGAPTVRFSRAADSQTLPLQIRGEFMQCNRPTPQPPPPPGPRPFWLTPTHPDSGILEPHNPKGARLQMAYREDDFQLSYFSASDVNLDVEQMHWSPFAGRQIIFDLFDRYTLRLSHSEYRPDIRVDELMGNCAIYAASFRHGLHADATRAGWTFAQNVLNGTTPVEVVTDKVYQMNPNNAFIGVTGTKFIGYPRFDRTYTWRDQRLLNWDPVNERPIGIGGVDDPDHTTNANFDYTADVPSPWRFKDPPPDYDMRDGEKGDFEGDVRKDHPPVALPLLMDFLVFPDDPANGLAHGANIFQIGYFGPPFPLPGHGYYNPNYIRNRVFSVGGVNNLNLIELVDPKNTFVPRGGWIQDPLLGRINHPGVDDHIHWAQADFVRRVSVLTSGYIDTLRPNRHDLGDLQSDWPGKARPNGFPDLAGVSLDLRAVEFDLILSPPPARQAPGTRLFVEFSGIESFENDDEIYNPNVNDDYLERGNLYNPLYAMEAFRYASREVPGGRVEADGIHPYVDDPRLLRGAGGRAPRHINWRITMENNIQVTPAVSPQLHSFGLVWRVRE